jgi:hypothetical protein
MPFDVHPSPWTLTAGVLDPFKRSGPMHMVPKVMLQIAVMGIWREPDSALKKPTISSSRRYRQFR